MIFTATMYLSAPSRTNNDVETDFSFSTHFPKYPVLIQTSVKINISTMSKLDSIGGFTGYSRQFNYAFFFIFIKLHFIRISRLKFLKF